MCLWSVVHDIKTDPCWQRFIMVHIAQHTVKLEL